MGQYSVNYTRQSYPSNISSLEHHLWQRKAAEEDFWRASASGWHCKTSSMEGAAMQGPGGGTAAQTLHSQRAAHLWWVGCGHGGDAAAWLVGAGKLLGGRGTGTGAGKEASPRGSRCCGGVGSSQRAGVRIHPHGTGPIHVHMDNLLKGRSSSSASPAVLL